MIRSSYPSEILNRYNTDKSIGTPIGHSYGRNFYDYFLPHYRWCNRVLEVGILNGESLRAWAEYFPDATIVGLDIEKKYLIQEKRIESYLVDAGNLKDFEDFAKYYSNEFSVAIDDGSHMLEHQLIFITVMQKYLKRGGILIVEDISTEENAARIEALGCKIEEYNTSVRSDDRIAYWIKP
jgi:cyclopropane fatty-acyl-phospholipid synthase-like methyltransferase